MNCLEKIDDLFSQWDTTKSPGCALALVQDGEVIFENGYGIATLEHHIPIRPTTAFYIASTSKQFSAFQSPYLRRLGNYPFKMMSGNTSLNCLIMALPSRFSI